MKRVLWLGAVVALATLEAGCAWVNPTSGGARVTVVMPQQARQCEKIGQTTATTQAKIWVFERDDKKIAEETATLARNSAADKGGNAIIPITKAVDGRQTFEILRCPNL